VSGSAMNAPALLVIGSIRWLAEQLGIVVLFPVTIARRLHDSLLSSQHTTNRPIPWLPRQVVSLGSHAESFPE
jgi:hypothetical protein